MTVPNIDPATGRPNGVHAVPFHLEDYPVDSSHRKLKIAMSECAALLGFLSTFLAGCRRFASRALTCTRRPPSCVQSGPGSPASSPASASTSA